MKDQKLNLQRKGGATALPSPSETLCTKEPIENRWNQGGPETDKNIPSIISERMCALETRHSLPFPSGPGAPESATRTSSFGGKLLGTASGRGVHVQFWDDCHVAGERVREPQPPAGPAGPHTVQRSLRLGVVQPRCACTRPRTRRWFERRLCILEPPLLKPIHVAILE